MTGVRFADVQARPAEFLNLTSLTLEEFEVLGVGSGYVLMPSSA